MSRYQQGRVLAITYDIWISGTKLGIRKKSCVKSIEITETVDGADSATIAISDPDFLFIEDDIFLEDSKIKIMMGWSNTTYRVTFSGYISAIDIDFTSSGIPQITLTCMDNTHVMNRTQNDNTWKDTTSADVVKTLVTKYGFTCVIESGYEFEKQETITQSHQTDIDFITKLAGDEVYPFTARLVGNTFYYVKKGKLETPKMSLTYKSYPHEIISFSPKLNKETKQVEIKSSKVNTSDKSVSSTTGSTSTKSGSATENGSNSSQSASQNYTYSKDSGRNSGKDDVRGGDSRNSGRDSGSYTYNPQTKKWSRNK